MTDVQRVALVTGGGTGIGRGIAIELAKVGYDIAISFHGSSDGAEKTVNGIKQIGQKAIAIKVDISHVSGIKEMYQTFRKHFYRLDLFVNNAGVTLKAPFLETDEELFDKIASVDYKGAFFCMQYAAKLMIENDTKGNIVLITSNNAVAHFADVSVYGSAKAAATKLSEHLAIELAKYGIRVNCIAPGWTDTGAARLDAKSDTYYKVPLQKWTSVEEIAKAVIFLSSDGAASITGTSLVMDNGALLVSDKRERYGF